MSRSPKLGQEIRAARLEAGHSLRAFAKLVDVSATYLSQVEQDKTESPPTAERIQKMAELLGRDADRWINMAGRLPEDVQLMVREHREGLPELLRATDGMSPEELRKLAARIKKKRES